MFAVVNINSSQYIASVGKIIKIRGILYPRGRKVIVSEPLLVKNGDNIFLGRELFNKKIFIYTTVLDYYRSPKKIVFKLHRRKGYRRKYGQRDNSTIIKINKMEII